MKVLGISCSPRAKGNTEVLVQKALNKAKEEGAEVELVSLAGKTIWPCDACYACTKTGKCHIEDDMQDIYTKLLEADGIIFGTPVYYWSLSAQAKALIDRTNLFRPKRDLRNKAAGVVIAQAAAGETGALAVFSNFFIIQRMIIVGRAVGLAWAKGEVVNDIRGIAQAEDLGEVMAKYLKDHEIRVKPEPRYKVEIRLKEDR